MKKCLMLWQRVSLDKKSRPRCRGAGFIIILGVSKDMLLCKELLLHKTLHCRFAAGGFDVDEVSGFS